MAKFKYAVDLMLEFECKQKPLKKNIKEAVEEAIKLELPLIMRLRPIVARVRSVDLD